MTHHTGFNLMNAGKASRNNGATVLYGGNINSQGLPTLVPSVTNAPSPIIMDWHSGINGAIVVSGVVHGNTSAFGGGVQVSPCRSDGTFAKMKPLAWIMYRAGTTVAGIPATNFQSNFLNTATADTHRMSVHLMTKFRTQHYVQTGWSYVTGRPLNTVPVTQDNFGNDVAATPTRAIPGFLVYYSYGPARRQTLSIPTTQNYIPKTD